MFNRRRLIALACGLLVALTHPDRGTSAQSLNGVGAGGIRQRIEAGRYADAEAEAERLLSGLESATTDERHRLAVDLLVEARTFNGRGHESYTRQLAESVVVERRSSDGLNRLALAGSLRNLGDVLFQSGNYQVAIARLREALSYDEAAGADSGAETAAVLAHLARALSLVGQQDEALRLADRAVTIADGPRPPPVLGVADVLSIRGQIWQRRGDYSKAHLDFQRGVNLLEQNHRGHPRTASGLAQLGYLLVLEGHLLKARDVLTQAVALAEAAYRPDHPEIAVCLGSLAIALVEVGDLSGARQLSERALAIAERAFGSDHPQVAVQLNDLANALQLQGDYISAGRLYERAFSIYERFSGAESLGAAAAIYNLALLNTSLGDFREAHRQFLRIIDVWSRIKGAAHPDVARALSALADTLAAQGLYDEARTFYQRALVIREQTLGSSHPLVAVTLSALASTLARQNQVRLASSLSTRALRIWEQSGREEGFAESLTLHGELLARTGDVEGARHSFERALEIRLPRLGPSHPNVAATEVALARAEARMGERAAAVTRALRGEQVGRQHLRLMLAVLPERQALDYAAARPRGLDLAISLATDLATTGSLLDAVIAERALVLDEISMRRRSVAESADPSAATLWSSLAAARQRLANVVIRGANKQSPEEYTAVVDEAQREKERAERALAERSAEFRLQLRGVEVGIAQVQMHLPPGTALVSFLRYERERFSDNRAGSSEAVAARRAPSSTVTPSYCAFVLKSGQTEPRLVLLGDAEGIEQLISGWRSAMVAELVRPAETGTSQGTLEPLGAALRKRVWEPLTTSLMGVERVFVVPDGSLNLVPLAALPDGPGHYLIEHGPVIHYLGAERDLVSDETRSTAGDGLLLAVGGPSYADQSPSTAPTKTASVSRVIPPESNAGFRGVLSSCGSFSSMRFVDLPATRVEAESVASLWQAFPGTSSSGRTVSTELLIGPDATEAAFKRLAPGKRVLHIATHGFFLGEECASVVTDSRGIGGLVAATPPSAPTGARARRTDARPANPLLLSGLAMAGANRRADAAPGEEDGILTAEEVSALNLDGVQWAVLSACDTGLGTLTAGEGVLGLRRAFQAAGARTVIMSLWSVEDSATRRWMEGLYQARVGQQLDTADAMRAASLTLLQDRRARGQTTNPFYWAGFVAAGDWR